jgi:hypothetical protein
MEEAVRTRFEQAMPEVLQDLKGLNQSPDPKQAGSVNLA